MEVRAKFERNLLEISLPDSPTSVLRANLVLLYEIFAG